MVLRHGLLCDILEGRMLGKMIEGGRIQLTDDLLPKKNYADLKKAAEDWIIWSTRRESLTCLSPNSTMPTSP